MFQNLQNDGQAEQKKDVNKKINIFSNVFTKQNILLYIVTFMVSSIGVGQGVSPFALSITVASFSYGIPALLIILLSLIGSVLGFGVNGALNYILTLLVFMFSFFIFKPKYNEQDRNEKLKLGKNLFIGTLAVGLIRLLISGSTIYDLLVTITLAIMAFVFYKIFVNSIVTLIDFREKRAFSIEEVIGASLLLAIAFSALGNFQILGFSIRNILCIFIVLVLGWKNGILIGTTSGVTIGVTLGIIAEAEPILVAAFAISGMIAGILNKFGKIGVILGFIIGNGILMYISNGGTTELILLKEILIASLGLLAIPKSIKIDIEEFVGVGKFLPSFPGNALNQSSDVAQKLNTVSEAIQDIAQTYNEVAVTTIDEQDTLEKNQQIFISELLNSLDNLQDNMLYDDISKVDGKIVDELFNILVKNQELTRKDLLKVFAENNSYIIGFDDEQISKYLEENIEQVVKAFNYSYRISKVNFVWTKKLEEKNKNMQAQLDGVSKAINNIVTDIQKDINSNNKFQKEKEQILELLEQKNIAIDNLSIKQQKNKRYVIDMYFKTNEIEEQDIKKIEHILSTILKENIILNENKQNTDILTFMSEDKFALGLGIAKTTKGKSSVSGDSILHLRLNDGKYLLLISDGMGSGPEARKSSQIATKMLERLLSSGFDRDTSIDLINTTILNTNEDIFATLDIAIVDLYAGNIEFIKTGACPSYIKNKKKVQIIKSLDLPAGILKQIDSTVYDRDIDNNDILLMCSDGILDSNVEYKNKELWVKYILEDIETDNTQKIADLILNEAIDNNFGLAKDDMSIIVCKFIKK